VEGHVIEYQALALGVAERQRPHRAVGALGHVDVEAALLIEVVDLLEHQRPVGAEDAQRRALARDAGGQRDLEAFDAVKHLEVLRGHRPAN